MPIGALRQPLMDYDPFTRIVDFYVKGADGGNGGSTSYFGGARGGAGALRRVRARITAGTSVAMYLGIRGRSGGGQGSSQRGSGGITCGGWWETAGGTGGDKSNLDYGNGGGGGGATWLIHPSLVIESGGGGGGGGAGTAIGTGYPSGTGWSGQDGISATTGSYSTVGGGAQGVGSPAGGYNGGGGGGGGHGGGSGGANGWTDWPVGQPNQPADRVHMAGGGNAGGSILAGSIATVGSYGRQPTGSPTGVVTDYGLLATAPSLSGYSYNASDGWVFIVVNEIHKYFFAPGYNLTPGVWIDYWATQTDPGPVAFIIP